MATSFGANRTRPTITGGEKGDKNPRDVIALSRLTATSVGRGTLLYRSVPVLMTTSRLFRKRMCVSSRRLAPPGHLGLLRLPPFEEPRLRKRVRLHRGRMTQHANAAASEYPPTRTAFVLQSSSLDAYPSTLRPPSF